MTNCDHKQIYLGLDAAYCPDCKAEFKSWTAEYKQALVTEVSGVNLDSSNLDSFDQVSGVDSNLYPTVDPGFTPDTCGKVKGEVSGVNLDTSNSGTCALVTEVSGVNLDSSGSCEHDWTILWTEDLELVDYCLNCHLNIPTCHLPTLERYQSSALEVLAEYKFALSKNPRSRKQFEPAIAEKKQQLQYLEQRIAALSESVQGENQDIEFPPELDPDQPVQGENQDIEFPPELDPDQPVQGENQDIEFPPELKKSVSGWLEKYIKNKKLQNGAIATYPRVEGMRDSDNPEHWYWSYRYEEKNQNAKSDNGFITRTVYLKKTKVEAVKLAIGCGWTIQKILQFIQNSHQEQ